MDSRTAKIACVGILCVDAMGKTVDSLPEKGKLKLVDSISLHIGGCASNVAISLAKIGLNPFVIGKIGDDQLGKILLNTLRSENVAVKGLRVDPSASTSASLVMISGDSERSIVHAMGANREFCFEDIDLNIVRDARILLMAGTFLMPGLDGPGTKKLLRFASENGVLCCMDTAWDSTGQWMNTIESSLPYLDWFMPSYEEARELSGETDPGAMADLFFSKGVKNVIIKLDCQGCFVGTAKGESFIVPAYRNIEVKDASGAGDSFCAGFVAGLYNGWSVRECAHFANAVGAHCVMEIGTTTGIKPMSDILAFMRAHEPDGEPIY